MSEDLAFKAEGRDERRASFNSAETEHLKRRLILRPAMQESG